MSVRYRGRARGPDAARVLLAVILVVLTTLIAMRGSVSDAGADQPPASVPSIAGSNAASR